jgi:hypothetical protein
VGWGYDRVDPLLPLDPSAFRLAIGKNMLYAAAKTRDPQGQGNCKPYA